MLGLGIASASQVNSKNGWFRTSDWDFMWNTINSYSRLKMFVMGEGGILALNTY